MIAITGSRVHRIWKCPPSAVLPQIEDDEPSPHADRGKAIHAYLERVKIIGEAAAMAEAPIELRPLLACLDLTALPVNLATEVAFLYDWKARTAREIGRNIGRDYRGHLARAPIEDINFGPRFITPTEIPITIDLLGGETRGETRRGYVGDYKSGHTKLPAPDRYGQTLLAALCVRHVYKADEVVLELIYIRSDGDHYPARRTLDQWDLDTFGDELERAMAEVARAELDYAAGRGVDAIEGPHCQHCPAFKQCPAKVALVRALPEMIADLPEPGQVTAARAAAIWMAVERYSDVFARVKEEICGIAWHEPIELPDGRVIGRVASKREKLDGRIAMGVVEQWYGPEAAQAAVTVSMSQEGLRDAVVAEVRKAAAIAGVKPPVIQSKKGDGVLDRVEAEIRQRGGIAVTESETVRPHVPKRLKP